MTCDADEIDIYSQSQKESIFTSNPLCHVGPKGLPVPHLSLTLQDGDWVKEAAMSASLRDTTEPSTWFRWLSLGVFAVAPLAGQIATGSRCQHDGRCVSCTRVPQQRWSLSAVNLHPPCRVSFSAEVAAAFTDAFFWRCGFA